MFECPHFIMFSNVEWIECLNILILKISAMIRESLISVHYKNWHPENWDRETQGLVGWETGRYHYFMQCWFRKYPFCYFSFAFSPWNTSFPCESCIVKRSMFFTRVWIGRQLKRTDLEDLRNHLIHLIWSYNWFPLQQNKIKSMKWKT